MEKNKDNIKKTAVGFGDGMKSFFDKTKDNIVKIVDQNEDGFFNKDDLSVFAENISEKTKETSIIIKEKIDEKILESERKRLNPILESDLSNADFVFSKLICICEMDKRYAESEVCQGAIGYKSVQKDLEIINVFRHKIDSFGLVFYPDTDSEVYYVDPSDRNKYIALEDYFDYLKIARVNELQKIAQDLGAKHFKVTYKEYKASFAREKAKGIMKAKGSTKSIKDSASIEGEHDLTSKEVSTVEVAAEMDCPGHEPFEPKLQYLQREENIQSLIALRMDKHSPITHQKYTLKLSNTLGIKQKDAIKIDAALKAMKINADTSIQNEVQKESRKELEYEVDF